MVKPVLGDVELQQVQSITIDGDQLLVEHGVPALEGDFFQRLNRRTTCITLNGVLTGAAVADQIKTLRDKFRAAEPVSFVADIASATQIDQVLIGEMGVRELAGKPERFEYTFTLREFIPPPPPREEPPPPQPDPPDIETATLEVTVEVEGQPNFDFSTTRVTVDGTEENGSVLSRTLTSRNNNDWTEATMPPGEYTARAAVTAPQPMSGTAAATVRGGQTTQVTITLRAVSNLAKAFVVHFRFDRAFVEPCMRHVLQRVVEHARNNPNEKVLIVGHTDLVGGDDYNQSLSERRGRAVFAFLTAGRDKAAAVAEWNELRQSSTGGLPSLRDNWSVREYQYMLQDLAFYVGNIDEQHGPKTDAAVRAFQHDHGLPETGVVDAATWQALIEAYLSLDDLAIPENQFFRNAKDACDGGILKWLGCGEKDPVKNTQDAWRPNRRTEILFVQAAALPCEVPQPVTFNLPTPGAVGSTWCLGPGDPNKRCCFSSRQGAQPNKFLIQPAEPEKTTVSGSITFEDGTPVANAQYALIAPDGEFLHTNAAGQPDLGERPQGDLRGRPIPAQTDANGNFSYPRETPVGTYILELLNLTDPQVARESDDPPQAARGNVICMQLGRSGAASEDGGVAPAPANAVVHAAPVPPPTVNPTITLAAPVVVVRKSYTNPARVLVTLRTSTNFNRTGTLTRSNNIGAIHLFRAAQGGAEISFSNSDNVFTGAQLTAGVQLFAESTTPSGNLNDFQLTLTLSPGPTPVGPPATVTLTAVTLSLDICMSRTAAGAAPVPLPQPPPAPPPAGSTPNDKWFGGRFVHVQDPGNNHGRALLIVGQVQPAGFAGDLVLRQVVVNANNIGGPDAKVRAFDNESPTAGEIAKSNPHEFNASTIPATGLRLWVEGRSVSASLRDTGYQLGVKNVENDGDRVRMTVAQFTRIQATVKPTPANTPANSTAAGIAAPANHVFSNTSFAEDFIVNRPLVLMRNGQPDIDLVVTAAPAGLPIHWKAIRNPNDHASLGAAAALPTVTPNAADPRRAQLNANQKGSFHIRAFIDANGNNTFEDREPSIPLNLVLADATVVADNSAAHSGPGTLSVSFNASGAFRVTNGSWTGGLPGAGMAMELIADVTGGGADGRLGLDRVFAGLINMVQVRDVVGSYRDTTVAPPTDHRLRFLAASNTGAASGLFGGRPLFRPGDPAVVLYTLPLLDSGRGGAGTGGETATMTRSAAHTSVNRPVGQRWTIQCFDSPGMTFVKTHPANANAVLRQVHYHYQFRACFCFWTNVNANRGATNDPAERTYSTLRIVDWEIAGDWNINYPPAPAAPTNAPTTPHNIRVTNRNTINPIGRAQDSHVEVRPPSGIQIAAWDGSN